MSLGEIQTLLFIKDDKYIAIGNPWIISLSAAKHEGGHCACNKQQPDL